MADNRPYWLRFMEDQDNMLADYEPDMTPVKEHLSEAPAGYLFRGDFEGAGKVAGAKVKEYIDQLQTPEGAMDLVNPMSKVAGIIGSIGKAGKRMSRAEAEAMGLYHPISKNKLTKPFNEITSTVEQLPNVKDVKIITPEDLYGGVGVAMKGDRANIGLLTNIDGTPLNEGILLQGGHRFMDQNPESIWASGAGRIKRYANQANKIAETGKTPYSVSVLSSHNALNFNTMMTDAYLQQIKNSNITQKSLKEFDKKVRQKRPEWLGINHPEAINQLNKTGELRHAFNEIVQKKEFQEKGFPNQAATKKAITDPNLYDTPLEYAGYRIGKMESGSPNDQYSNIIKDPTYSHNTYPDQLRGSVEGSMETQLPFGFMFPDFLKGRRAANQPMSGDSYAIERSDIYQDFNQKWLDQIMPEYEKRIKGIL